MSWPRFGAFVSVRGELNFIVWPRLLGEAGVGASLTSGIPVLARQVVVCRDCPCTHVSFRRFRACAFTIGSRFRRGASLPLWNCCLSKNPLCRSRLRCGRRSPNSCAKSLCIISKLPQSCARWAPEARRAFSERDAVSPFGATESSNELDASAPLPLRRAFARLLPPHLR